MEIDNKYLLLLHKLIYDPRSGENGLISRLEISPCFFYDKPTYRMCYKVFFNRIHSDSILYINDINDKKIKFLIPVNLTLSPKEEKEYQDQTIKDIKEYFGDDFSEDILMYIPEEKRQQQIAKENKSLDSLYYWDRLTKE